MVSLADGRASETLVGVRARREKWTEFAMDSREQRKLL
jgi:hypothetical protein